jgi:XRE family transcriptional regulator, regulator of sulfur utilization
VDFKHAKLDSHGMSLPQLSRGGRPPGRVSFNAESAVAFGMVVRAHRRQNGLSQEALAHLADIERTHFSSIERGKNQPSLWLILKISKALGISSADLMSKTEQLLLSNDLA